MNVNALQLAVRALTGAMKDLSFRADPEPASAPVAPAAPAGDATQAPPQAMITGAGAAAQAMNAQVAARGSMLATVVSALGGSRYLLSVEGEDTPVVLSAAAVKSGGEFAPGTVVRLVPSTPMAATPAPLAPQPDAEVSVAGRLLAQTGASPVSDPRSPLAPASITASTAPLVQRPDAPETLARFLAQTVAESGLFYESHLADWVTGQRTMSALAGEPQLHWQASAEQSSAVADAGRPSVPSPAPPLPAIGAAESEGLAHASTASAATLSAPGALDTGKNPLSALAPAAQSLVREQLQALSSQWVAWRGDVWPGQQAAVELGRDPTASGGEAAQPWRAHLAVTLPTLGRVDITLALTGSRVDVRVTGDSTAHAAQLAGARLPLLERLQSHGMMPSVRFAAAQGKAREPA